MRSDNMMMLHVNNRYRAKNTTFEGELISAENTYKAPIEVEVLGKTEQNVTVQGKNLWSLSSYYYAYTGVGFTSMDSGTFTLPINFHGTFILSAYITRYSDDVVTNPRFSIKIFYTDGTSNAFAGFFNNIPADGAEHFVYITGTSDVTKTIDHIGGWLFDYSSSTFRHIEARNIQLELGSTATAYEPFVPDSPSPDYPSPIQSVLSGTSVESVGRNLTTISNLDIAANVVVTPGIGAFYFVKGVQYTLSWNQDLTLVSNIRNTPFIVENATNLRQYAAAYGNGYLSEGRHIWTFVSNFTGLCAIRYWGNTLSNSVKLTDFQLELGSTATTYQPYMAGGSAISEYNLYSGDKWNVASGEYVFEKAVYEFTGNESWTLYPRTEEINPDNIGFALYTDNILSVLFPTIESMVSGVVCSHFKLDSTYTAITEAIRVHLGNYYTYIAVKKSRLSSEDVAGFKAWLAAQHVTIIYQRAVPLVIEGTARLISSVPRHTNIFTIPALGGLVLSLKATMKTY